MNRFIFGFQRRVWWPKWTPASSRSFMDTTDTGPAPFNGLVATSRRRREEPAQGRHRLSSVCRRVGWQKHAQGSNACPPLRATSAVECSLEFGRERRLRLDRLARDRVREREARGMQELALEVEVAHAVDAIARYRQVD